MSREKFEKETLGEMDEATEMLNWVTKKDFFTTDIKWGMKWKAKKIEK